MKTEKHIEIHRNGHRRAEDNAQLGGEDVHVPDHPFPAVCGHRDDHHAHHHPRKIHAVLNVSGADAIDIQASSTRKCRRFK